MDPFLHPVAVFMQMIAQANNEAVNFVWGHWLDVTAFQAARCSRSPNSRRCRFSLCPPAAPRRFPEGLFPVTCSSFRCSSLSSRGLFHPPPLPLRAPSSGKAGGDTSLSPSLPLSLSLHFSLSLFHTHTHTHFCRGWLLPPFTTLRPFFFYGGVCFPSRAETAP